MGKLASQIISEIFSKLGLTASRKVANYTVPKNAVRYFLTRRVRGALGMRPEFVDSRAFEFVGKRGCLVCKEDLVLDDNAQLDWF